MSTLAQFRLQKILHHLHPLRPIVIINKCSSNEEDEENDNNKELSSVKATLATSRIKDIQYNKQAKQTNEIVAKANRQTQQSLNKQVQAHGHISEIQQTSSFNIDSTNKGSNVWAERNPNYHAKSDVLVKNKITGEIVEKVQIKNTKSKGYAKKTATNKDYKGMKKVVNQEMSHQHPELQSKFKVDGVESKPYKYSDMKKKQNFDEHKTSQKQIKKKRMQNDAKSAALIGGVVSGGLSVVTDIYEGEKSTKEIIKDGVIETTKGAVIGAATSVVTTVIGTGPAAAVLGIVEIAKYCIDNEDDITAKIVLKKTVTVAATTTASMG
eukprot:37269_1